jgi:preprotein translocase subunit SecG
MLYNIILVALVTVSVVLIGLILIQHGKGAEAGAAFGGGASGTVFGSEGSGSFLTKTTGVLATLFFVLSLSLAYIAAQQSKQASATTDEFAPALQKQQVESDIPVVETSKSSDVVSDVPVADVPVSNDTSSVPKSEK